MITTLTILLLMGLFAWPFIRGWIEDRAEADRRQRVVDE